MKVSSPIGDLPFEPRRLRLRGGALVMEGEMGAWPAHVQIDASDIPSLARLFWLPLFAAVTVVALLIVLAVIGW